MKKTALQIVLVVALLVAGCSVIVNADRSKVQDSLFQPVDAGSGGSAGSMEPDTDAAGDAEAEDGGSDGAATTDGGVAEGAAADGAAADGAVVDGVAADGLVIDAGLPDGTLPLDGAAILDATDGG